ncbi:putative bifunctional diguanylate cyclase/phosphodiesterase [Actinoplanes sp. CA-030573]|uniref:putative bifunctional diguanylate cyclase/phosphodiesterase n=1 Tax=Actinoplanes sp. CA-030573 TaxID=3239898 RepID=UPI003D901A37
MAVSGVLMIALGIQVALPQLLVWVPAVVGPVLASAAFWAAADGADGGLGRFWRRLSVAMGLVAVAAVSQVVDVVTMPYQGMPPIGARTLLLYVTGTVVAIGALLRLPGGGRSWRRLVTAVLDVAVVAVTAGIAASQYVGWFVGRFGVSAPAWWLNIAMIAIAVGGVVVVVKIMSSRQSPVSQAALWWLAPVGLCGPLSTVLMSVLRPWPYLNGSAAVLPFVGLFGVLAAHAHRLTMNASGDDRPASGAHRIAARLGSTVPLIATSLTGLLLAALVLRTGHLSVAEVGGTVLLLLLVVARQAIAMAENAALLATVEYQAAHDDLTGLFSRRHFTAAVAAAHGSRTVVLVDLNDFRELNDTLGSQAGDELLVGFAHRLTRLAGDGATVARLGGDDFGVLLPRRDPGFADRLSAANREPLPADDREVAVDASVGIAEGSHAGLHRQAEIALRAAVAAGGGAVRYDAALESQLTRRATLAAELRAALRAEQFHLLFQPIVELPHGRMTGVESLIRWTRPDGQVVSPAEFIPVAEDTGLIVEIGAWIIDQVCAQIAAWRHEFGPDLLSSVSVNVSARQLLDPALPAVLTAALDRHGVPPRQLTVEITETAVFSGSRALAAVHALSELGCSIALDDFGTGHSSLGLLRTCPVDVIKVDKSFVDELGGTAQQEAIAAALAGLASTLGLRTVAEGVETAAQAERLFELGYRRAQGFLFARPLPAAEIGAMLRQQERAAA